MYLLVDGDYFLSGFTPSSDDAVKGAVDRLMAAIETQLLRPAAGGGAATAVIDARLIFFSSALLDGLAAEARACVISTLRRHRFQTNMLESIRGRPGTPVDGALCTKLLQLGALPAAGGAGGAAGLGGGGGGGAVPKHAFCLVTPNAYVASALEVLVSRECGEVVFAVFDGDDVAEVLLGYASARYGGGGVATMAKQEGVNYVPDTAAAITALEMVQQQQRGRLPLSTLTELKNLQVKLQNENAHSSTGATVSMPAANPPAAVPEVGGGVVLPPVPGVTDLFNDAKAPAAPAVRPPPAQPPTAPSASSSDHDDDDDGSGTYGSPKTQPPPEVPSTFMPTQRVNPPPPPQQQPQQQPPTGPSFFAPGPSRLVTTATSPAAVVQQATPPTAQPPLPLIPAHPQAAQAVGEPPVATLLPAEWGLLYDPVRQRHYYASVDSTGRARSTWQHPLGPENQRELEEKVQAWRAAQAATAAHSLSSASQPASPAQLQAAAPANYVLPEGWEQRVDQRTGRTFYVNHITRSTSWTPPSMAPSVASSTNPTPMPAAHAPAAAAAAAAGAADGPAEEWESRVDPASGRTFYVNHRTKQTSWTRPAPAPPAPAPAPAPAAPAALPPMWEASVDPASGRTYYINHATKTTSWERPTY